MTLLLAAAACITPPAPPLEQADFVLGGIPVDSDSAEIRLTFGEPDSTTNGFNPFGAEPLVTWHYEGFEVRFAGGPLPSGFLISAPGESTLRGLRVGDSMERVLQLYGEPSVRLEAVWTYVDNASPDVGLQVVDILLDQGVVGRIYLGRAAG
ncbi:MAG: hypothetical protein WEF86_06140 [Gemmatimonadota bacterium]